VLVEPAARRRVAQLGALAQGEQRLVAARRQAGPGDVDDLVVRQVGVGEARRGLGERAVAAAVLAEHRERDEDLGGVGHPVAVVAVPDLGGLGHHLVEVEAEQVGALGAVLTGHRRAEGGLVEQPAHLARADPPGREVLASSRARTASRFDSPITVTTHRRECAIAENVIVRRSWRLLPVGSVLATT